MVWCWETWENGLFDQFSRSASVSKRGSTRGEIVVKFLEGSMSATDFTADALLNSKHYNHYNLLCYDGNEIVYGSTSKQILRPLTPGCYGLSNDDLDHHWPKVRFGLPIFTRVLGRISPDGCSIFSL